MSRLGNDPLRPGPLRIPGGSMLAASDRWRGGMPLDPPDWELLRRSSGAPPVVISRASRGPGGLVRQPERAGWCPGDPFPAHPAECASPPDWERLTRSSGASPVVTRGHHPARSGCLTRPAALLNISRVAGRRAARDDGFAMSLNALDRARRRAIPCQAMTDFPSGRGRGASRIGERVDARTARRRRTWSPAPPRDTSPLRWRVGRQHLEARPVANELVRRDERALREPAGGGAC